MNREDKRLYLAQAGIGVVGERQIVAFSYPKTFKFTRDNLETLVDEFVDSLNSSTLKYNVFVDTLKDVSLQESEKFKHKDYKFSSLRLKTQNVEKLRYLKYKHRISMSAILRNIITNLVLKNN